MNLNKVLIAGRLTADPQLRTTPTGQQVASFSVATNRNWTAPDGRKQEAVEFHNVVVWGRQADVVSRFMNKGSLILVEGRLQTRSWDDKQGQRRKTTEIIGERIQFGPRPFGGGPSAGSGQAGSFSKPDNQHSPPAEANEIPTVNIEEPAVEEIKAEDLPF